MFSVCQEFFHLKVEIRIFFSWLFILIHYTKLLIIYGLFYFQIIFFWLNRTFSKNGRNKKKREKEKKQKWRQQQQPQRIEFGPWNFRKIERIRCTRTKKLWKLNNSCGKRKLSILYTSSFDDKIIPWSRLNLVENNCSFRLKSFYPFRSLLTLCMAKAEFVPSFISELS